MEYYFDDLMGVWIVEFRYFGKNCAAYFETAKEAELWRGYVESKSIIK